MTKTTEAATAIGDAAPEISITVNATPHTLRAGSLAEVLVALEYGGQKVATALNGDFVPERMRSDTPVKDGDTIEILSARQGG